VGRTVVALRSCKERDQGAQPLAGTKLRGEGKKTSLLPRVKGQFSIFNNQSLVDLRTFDEVVWSATYPSETDV